MNPDLIRSTRRTFAASALGLALLSSPGTAQDMNSVAERLMREAADLTKHAEHAPTQMEALPLFQQAQARLQRIVEEYPNSRVATRLVLGDPLARKIDAAVRNAREQATNERASCVRSPHVGCVLSLAAIAAQQITAPRDRAIRLVQLAEAHRQIGNPNAASSLLESATKAAREAAAAGWYSDLLISIAKERASLGDGDSALAVLDLSPDRVGDTRVQGTLDVATILARAGKSEAAQRVVSSLASRRQEFSAGRQVQILRGAARIHSLTGQEDQARTTLRAAASIVLSDPAFRSPEAQTAAFTVLADDQVRINDLAGARETIRSALAAAESARDPSQQTFLLLNIEYYQSKTGDHAAALSTVSIAFKTLDRIRSEPDRNNRRRQATTALAGALARAGNALGALAIAEQSTDEVSRKEILEAILFAQSEIGDGNGAAATAERISDWGARLEHLHVIGFNLVKAQRFLEARPVLLAATRTIERFADESSPPPYEALGTAESLITIGQVDAAKPLVDRLLRHFLTKPHSAGVSYTVQLAKIQKSMGDPAAAAVTLSYAFEPLLAMPPGEYRARELVQLAEAEKHMGSGSKVKSLLALALQDAERMQNAFMRTYALQSIAIGLPRDP